MATQGALIAAAQAGKQAVVLLQCQLDGETAQLTLVAEVVIGSIAFPARLCFTAGELWVVGSSDSKGHISVGRAHTSTGPASLS